MEILAEKGELDSRVCVARRGNSLGFFIPQTGEFIEEGSKNWMRGMEDKSLAALWEAAK